MSDVVYPTEVVFPLTCTNVELDQTVEGYDAPIESNQRMQYFRVAWDVSIILVRTFPCSRTGDMKTDQVYYRFWIRWLRCVHFVVTRMSRSI